MASLSNPETKKTLYVSDLDGTLLNGEAQLSASSRNTLKRLLAKGIPFTIATSRSHASVQHIFQGVELTLPIIEVNGAYVSDLKTGQHQVVSTIEQEILPHLLTVVRSHQCNPLISSTDGSTDHLYCDAIDNDGIAWYAEACEREKDKRWQTVPDCQVAFQEQVVRFTLIQTEKQIRVAEAAIAETFDLNTHSFENPYHPGWFWLTVQSPRSTKANAIQALRSLQGFEDYELVVFGDEKNDTEMFELADRAIAVANAIPPLKAIAHHVIGSHLEESVVQFLMEDWEQGEAG